MRRKLGRLAATTGVALALALFGGISLALLLHVTLALLGLTLLYQALERVATRWPRFAIGAAAALVAASAVTFAAVLA